jgi:hypothetical protein
MNGLQTVYMAELAAKRKYNSQPRSINKVVCDDESSFLFRFPTFFRF